MNKIEIHDIQELLNQGYSVEYINKILNKILILSMQVKDDYPDYRQWFQTVQIPGIYDETRNIIVAHINYKIVGFVSLKKTDEKKICTFYVEKNYRKNKIGALLAEKAINYLEEEKPLITIPMDKLHEFIKIASKYNWEVTEIKENLYRTTTPEVIVNGSISTTQTILQDNEKTLKKVYRIYKMITLKKKILYIISFPQKLWK